MDVNLPGLSGTAATRRIRAHPDPRISTLPIIGISAHVQPEDIAENLAAGMSAMLAKPLSPEALQTALRDHVPDAGASPLNTLVKDIGPSRAVALARVFLDGLPKARTKIERAAVAKDYATLSRAAHQLKGAAGNFDFGDLTSRLAQIENLADRGELAELEAELNLLSGDLRRVEAQLSTALAQLQSSSSQAAR